MAAGDIDPKAILRENQILMFSRDLYNLRCQKVFTDVNLICEHDYFPAHKSILAVASNYFMDRFVRSPQPGQSGDLHLPRGVSSRAVDILLRFVYTGELDIQEDDKKGLKELLLAARVLEVDLVVHYCAQFVDEGVTKDNFIEKWESNDPNIKIEVAKFVAKEFASVRLLSDFMKIPFKCLEIVLTHPDLVANNSADDILKTALKWVSDDSSARLRYIKDILGAVQFSQLSDGYLGEMPDTEELMEESRELMKAVMAEIKARYRRQKEFANSPASSRPATRSATPINPCVTAPPSKQERPKELSVQQKLEDAFSTIKPPSVPQSVPNRREPSVTRGSTMSHNAPVVKQEKPELHSVTQNSVTVKKEEKSSIPSLLPIAPFYQPQHKTTPFYPNPLPSHPETPGLRKLNLYEGISLPTAKKSLHDGIKMPVKTALTPASSAFGNPTAKNAENVSAFAKNQETSGIPTKITEMFASRYAARHQEDQVNVKLEKSENPPIGATSGSACQVNGLSRSLEAVNSSARESRTAKVLIIKLPINKMPQIQISDIATKSTTNVNFTPDKDIKLLIQAATCVHGNKVYFAGGRDESTFDVVNSFCSFDTETQTWEKLAPMNTARAGAGAAVLNGLLYVVGGVGANSRRLSTIEYYYPAGGYWGTAHPLNLCRESPGVCGYNGKLYILGGYTTTLDGMKKSAEGAMASYEIYNPQSDSCVKLDAAVPLGPNIPSKKFLMAEMNGKLYALRVQYSEPLGNFYQFNSLSWDEIKSMFGKVTHWSSMSVVSDDRFLLVDGDGGVYLYKLGENYVMIMDSGGDGGQRNYVYSFVYFG